MKKLSLMEELSNKRVNYSKLGSLEKPEWVWEHKNITITYIGFDDEEDIHSIAKNERVWGNSLKLFLNAQTRNAVVEIYPDRLVWLEGEWDTGYFGSDYKNASSFVWKDGVWHDGKFYGTWHGGVWKGGNFINGDWYGGVWEYGFWYHYGLPVSVVKAGIEPDSKWHGGVWNGGRYLERKPTKSDSTNNVWVSSKLNPKQYLEKNMRR